MARAIALTRGAVAIVDDEDYQRLAQYSWSALRNGYAKGWVRINGTKRLIYMHRFILGIENEPRSIDTDHANGDRLDNRKANLRACTRSQNCGNARGNQEGTSRFKGVSFETRTKRWKAATKANGQYRFLGRFTREEDAAKAYDRVALQEYGKFARLNFPQTASLGNGV